MDSWSMAFNIDSRSDGPLVGTAETVVAIDEREEGGAGHSYLVRAC